MTLLVEPTSLKYTCASSVDVRFFLQWTEDFLIWSCVWHKRGGKLPRQCVWWRFWQRLRAACRAQVTTACRWVANNTLHCSWLCHLDVWWWLVGCG